MHWWETLCTPQGRHPAMGMESLMPLIQVILRDYPLDPFGIHGLPHWGRVLAIGRKLAKATGADPYVVELFALFHDACRRNEGLDPAHGRRGALLARELNGGLFHLSERRMNLLVRACSTHTRGHAGNDEDITVLACWDADRLDMARVGAEVDAAYLSTPAAKDPEVITWAARHAVEDSPSDLIRQWIMEVPVFSKDIN